MPPLDVLSFGEIVTDCFPDGKQLLGGAPLNVALHLRRFGCKALVITAVGPDDLGKSTLDFLKKEGVDGQVQFNPFPTGRVQIKIYEQGHSFEIEQGCAWEYLSMPSPVPEAQALVFGTMACWKENNRQILQGIMEQCPTKLRVLDLNIRLPYFDRFTADWCLFRANFLKISDEELESLVSLFGLQGNSREEHLRALSKFKNISTILLTLGAQGAWLLEKNEITRIPAHPIKKVVDTVGAGDAFLARFLYGYLRGNSPVACLEGAARFAAGVCSLPGCHPPNSWAGYHRAIAESA